MICACFVEIMSHSSPYEKRNFPIHYSYNLLSEFFIFVTIKKEQIRKKLGVDRWIEMTEVQRNLIGL